MSEIVLWVFEILTVVACIHRMQQKKLRFDFALLLLIIYDVILYYSINNLNISLGLSVSIYVAVFIYSLHEFKEKLSVLFMECLLSELFLIVMQLIYYIPVSFLIRNPYQDILIGCVVNIFCFLTVVFWGNKIGLAQIVKYVQQKNILTYLCFGLVICYLSFHMYKLWIGHYWGGIQFIEILIWILLILIMWFQVQKNKTEKIEKEVQLQEQAKYMKSFEEQLNYVRFKQHDIKNHLSAFYGMMEEAKDHNELSVLQKKYCDYLLDDKDYKRLIKGGNPIFTGFLNKKVQEMDNDNINFQYQIAYLELEAGLSIYEWIEVTGILLDNAMEAVKNQPDGSKSIYMDLSQNEEQIVLKISNISRYIDSVESTLFFQKGYSTKGKDRGIGLAKVKELVLRKNGEIAIRNISQEGQNWIEFSICFTLK